MRIIKNIKKYVGIGLLAGVIGIGAACGTGGIGFSNYDRNDSVNSSVIEDVIEETDDEKCDKYFFRDNDGDGYGDVSVYVCQKIPGYVENNLDCDDNNMDLNPDTIEKCNKIDDDCDGNIDDVTQPCSSACGDAGVEECIDGKWQNCNAEGLEEICNGKDDDCNGVVDDNIDCPEFYCNEALVGYLECNDQDCKDLYLSGIIENDIQRFYDVLECFENNGCNEYPTEPCNYIGNQKQGNICMMNNCFDEYYWCIAGSINGEKDMLDLFMNCYSDNHKGEECITCYDQTTEEGKKGFLELMKCIMTGKEEECMMLMFGQ